MARKSEADRIYDENLERAEGFFAQRFLELKDPRRPQGVRYPLSLVVVSALLACVAGADDAEAMEFWSLSNADWLNEFLPMPHGPPTQDVYLAVFGALCPKNFEAVFRAWVAWLQTAVVDERHIAIDGKSSRGSAAGDSLGLHSLNAWLVDSGLVVAQEGSDKKKGEIKAIPPLLKKLDLKGAIITIDAIGCQRTIAQEIISQGGDYFLQVKANQPQLLYDCERLFSTVETGHKHSVDNRPPSVEIAEDADKGHGRVEVRRAEVCHEPDWLTAAENWSAIASIVKITRERFIVGSQKTSQVSAYYISSQGQLTPEKALALSRNHWTIENSLHWVLDVAFGEDNAQHRARNSAENFSLLRKWSLNLIKVNKDKKGGVKNNRRKAGWDRNYLIKLITQRAFT